MLLDNNYTVFSAVGSPLCERIHQPRAGTHVSAIPNTMAVSMVGKGVVCLKMD